MSMPSPFEMGKAIGGNVSGGIREGVENSAIDQILQQAQSSGDPAQVQNIMNQIITQVSPEKRPIVEQALKNRYQQLEDANTQSEMYKIGEKIKIQNPGSSLHEALSDIYMSKMPLDQKEKVIKALSTSMPYKFEQQQRLMKDSILKRYNSRIKEAETSIKNARYFKDKDKHKKTRDDLVKERDELLDFASLRDLEEDSEEEIGASGKTVFNPENANHKEEAQALYNKYKDKKKVQKELSKKYEF